MEIKMFRNRALRNKTLRNRTLRNRALRNRALKQVLPRFKTLRASKLKEQQQPKILRQDMQLKLLEQTLLPETLVVRASGGLSTSGSRPSQLSHWFFYRF